MNVETANSDNRLVVSIYKVKSRTLFWEWDIVLKEKDTNLLPWRTPLLEEVTKGGRELLRMNASFYSVRDL